MKINETDLGRLLQKNLEDRGYDCYPEAQFRSRGKRADLIAIKHESFWVIEIKKNINITLLEQAYYWHQHGAIEVSIAIAKPLAKKQIRQRAWVSPFIDRVLREHGIGLFLIDTENDRVIEPIKPKTISDNQPRAESLYLQLDSRMKMSTPGSKIPNNTPASRSKENIDDFLRHNEVVSLSQIIEKVNIHHHKRIRKKNFILNYLLSKESIDVTRNGYEYMFRIKRSL